MTDASDTSSQTEQPNRRWTLQRIVIIAAIVFILFLLLPFIVGLVLAFADIERAGEFISIIRDLFLIVLALQGILIVFALVVLILQIAGLVNLLQNEIGPVLVNLQDTLNTAKGTAQFVGKNVTQPIVKAGGFFAGATVFARELGGLRRALRRNSNTREIADGSKGAGDGTA